MMNRIEKIQRRYNEYRNDNQDVRFAYVALMWDASEDYINRFVKNINDGHVSDELCKLHKLPGELVQKVKNGDSNAFNEARLIVEESIGWTHLLKKQPNKETYKIARAVSTNLRGLEQKQINALIEVSDWMTEVQVKTYLPNLID